ncbi:hypothetical protein FRC12_010138 [Ceratobasidium sp. 428]|nr:hypothetical protein FRC12_010138 [Ceratobasidium sp. 428]
MEDPAAPPMAPMKWVDIKFALEARNLTILFVDGEWRCVDMDTGLAPASLPHRAKTLKFKYGDEPKGSPNRGAPAGYSLQEATGMSDLHYKYQQADLKLICDRTRSIDMSKTITQQVRGAVNLVIRQFVEFHPEFEVWSKKGYWNLKAGIQCILRTSACRAKKMSAASETAIKPRRKRGRPRKSAQVPVPTSEPADIPEVAQGDNEDGETFDLNDVRSDDGNKGGVDVQGEGAGQGEGNDEVGGEEEGAGEVDGQIADSNGEAELEDEDGGEGVGKGEHEDVDEEPMLQESAHEAHEHELEHEPEPEPEPEHEPEPELEPEASELGEVATQESGGEGGRQAWGEGIVPDDDMVIEGASVMDAVMFDSSAINLNPNATVHMSIDGNGAEDDEDDDGQFDMSQVTGNSITLKPTHKHQGPALATQIIAPKPALATQIPAPKPKQPTLATQISAAKPQKPASGTQMIASKAGNVAPAPQAKSTSTNSGKASVPAAKPASKSTTVTKQPAPRASSVSSSNSNVSAAGSAKTQVSVPVQLPVSSSADKLPVSNVRKSGANGSPGPAVSDAAAASVDASTPPPSKAATSITWHGMSISQQQLKAIRANAARQAAGQTLRVSPVYQVLIDKLAEDPNYDPASDPLPPPDLPADPPGRSRGRKAAPPPNPTITTPTPAADDTVVEQPVTRRNRPRMKPVLQPELELEPVADTETDSNFALLDEGECVVEPAKTEGRVTRAQAGAKAKDTAKPAAPGKGKAVAEGERVVANTSAAPGGKNKAQAKNKVSKVPARAPAGTGK